MRCPDPRSVVAGTLLVLFTGLAAANPEVTRTAITERFQRDFPALSPADYALGAAAFDAELRAQVEANAGAAQAAGVVEAGKKVALRKFKNGRTIAGCFPNGGKRIAATYPQYDSRLKRIVTLETAVNQCLKTHNEPLLDPADTEMATLTAYLRSLSDQQKIAVRIPTAANEKFEEGRRLYFTRLGQRNYACATCHVQGAGKRYDDLPLSPALGQATHWPIYRDAKPVTLQARIRECLERMGAAPFAAGSDELNHIELFLTYLSNGMPLRANAWRSR
ncbi:sulfur oxidation c-type cytochrome SoxA [Usitatibacter palustris]|uniref:SoxAX cytochrome complex subunit A n=1 Tax=Usitatibacter palustris TaxID=2732487 RepID=A0A6M4H4M3_9PROT|nr:sulfur oxidation c-type cytochrome SoxA [Usitatibacter palustris]QJR14579.1 L-cysteine S-thiosulfotransferase subunit SoxA [Usitatibacter palustris]